MSITVTSRAVEVLRRALEVGRMDPKAVGIRVSVVRGPGGEDVRTGFADQPEPGDETIEIDGVRLFFAPGLAGREATIDVADEHDRIVLI